MADEPKKIQIVPQRVLCQLFDLTPRRINQLAKDNVIPTPVARDQYDLIGCIRAYIAFLRKGEDGSAITAHRTRKERFKADMAKMEAQQMAGELVSMASVEDSLTMLLSAVRTRLLAIPAKIAARIRMAANALEAQEIMRQEINDALADIQNIKIIMSRIAVQRDASDRGLDDETEVDSETDEDDDSLGVGGQGENPII